MATGNMTVTTHANFIPEVWSKEILDQIESNLVLANLVWRFDSDVADYGDTIHVPNVTGLTANDKAASTDVTFETNTESVTDISINKHKYVAFKLEDITKVQSKYDLRSIYTGRAGYSLAKAIDTSIASLYTDFSGQVVAGGSGLTDANVIAAVEYLDKADAPRDQRAFVIHSIALADLRALDKFTRYDATGQTGVQNTNGLIAKLYGVDVYLSNNMVDVAGTPNSRHNLMFHKDAMALAMQEKPRVQAQYMVKGLATEVVADAIYGVKTMRATFGVDVSLND